MKRLRPISTGFFSALLLVTLSAGTWGDAMASPAPDNAPEIVRMIEEGSEGSITVDIPSDLLDKILSNPESGRKTQGTANNKGYGRMNGFRIQVFSDGRNQHTLEARAKARGNAILARFPKYRGQVYTNSASPNWYTRIGNFRTTAEANAALEELKRAFPQYSSEMRIVKSKVVISPDKD